MNDQLFQQLLDSITQMTEIIKKQQETIDKLTTREVEYITVEEITSKEAQKRIDDTKTTGINEQKDVATSGRSTMPTPPPCRLVKVPHF